jgi:hypothetical protein
VPVVLLIVAAVILGGVVVVAIGRGGELARFPADVLPFEAEIVTAADVVLLRPPTALFGYNRQVTDDVLSAIARTITERDVEIATLRRQLAALRSSSEQATADPPTAADIWPSPSARPSAIRRGLTGPPRPLPQAWSDWDPPASVPSPPPAEDFASPGTATADPAADWRPVSADPAGLAGLATAESAADWRPPAAAAGADSWPDALAPAADSRQAADHSVNPDQDSKGDAR